MRKSGATQAQFLLSGNKHVQTWQMNTNGTDLGQLKEEQ